MLVEQILSAVGVIFEPYSLLLLAAGVALGILFGAIPGLTATMGVALLIPLTFVLEPAAGIVMLVGIYCGGIYGGSISAVLVSIPGTPSGMMTTLDGYPMGQRGEAGKAIGYATISSFIGGIISAIILIFAAPYLAKIALQFGPVEYFAIAVFGLSIISSVSGDSFVKGMISGVIGMMVTVVGMDYVTSTPRFTFGTVALLAGFTFIPTMIGLFGMREFLLQVGTENYKYQVEQKVDKVIPSLSEIRKLMSITIRGGLLGTFVGALPGAGGPIASFISYDSARKSSKHPEKFGTGIPEGIAASESANNGVTGGALIPMLTLGVPGDGVTAVMLGAFMVHNLRPGPMLFQNNADLVFAIYIGLILANVLMLIFGLMGAKLFARILNLPMEILLPFISVLTIVGSYAIRNNPVDIAIMIGFGLLGYLMSELKLPAIPMVLGIVLGPMAEANLRGALLISKGSWLIFLTEPISLILLILTVVLGAWPFLSGALRKKQELEGNTTSE
ncbi:MAG: putative tricarboxylic transport rane protein [Clostridia bacterium]|nr:putative tricarboxylic transport rane protein [Clostridia bacterium]